MTLIEIVKSLNLKVYCGNNHLERTISTGYSADLLSKVLSSAPRDALLITSHCHINVVAVAVMRHLSAILIVDGIKPDTEMTERAIIENIPILGSIENTFNIIGKLYSLIS